MAIDFILAYKIYSYQGTEYRGHLRARGVVLLHSPSSWLLCSLYESKSCGPPVGGARHILHAPLFVQSRSQSPIPIPDPSLRRRAPPNAALQVAGCLI